MGGTDVAAAGNGDAVGDAQSVGGFVLEGRIHGQDDIAGPGLAHGDGRFDPGEHLDFARQHFGQGLQGPLGGDDPGGGGKGQFARGLNFERLRPGKEIESCARWGNIVGGGDGDHQLC